MLSISLRLDFLLARSSLISEIAFLTSLVSVLLIVVKYSEIDTNLSSMLDTCFEIALSIAEVFMSSILLIIDSWYSLISSKFLLLLLISLFHIKNY